MIGVIRVWIRADAFGGSSTSPWVVVGAVAGLSYAVGLVVLQRRG
ncbi:MAG: hypothetical protein ACYDAG_05505 [Chloroflexota bacterium]